MPAVNAVFDACRENALSTDASAETAARAMRQSTRKPPRRHPTDGQCRCGLHEAYHTCPCMRSNTTPPNGCTHTHKHTHLDKHECDMYIHTYLLLVCLH
eukprot:TRINITY_DN42347_c0_g1_i1.p1 TRINITY_DN42347_c0_g1~~TRINITY_DN42347_c0_g1_i1.p1  ORF type:complete len:106 (-),score=0.60 TRINITY_DN42347_c0_g1_i1:236-532(-)